MKQNWKIIQIELRKLAVNIKGSTSEEFPANLANLEDFVFKTVEQSKQEERERILKELPKEDQGWENYSEFGKGIVSGKNNCLKQIEAMIKK